MNAHATIGHNGPPEEIDPLADLTKSIEDAYGEAKVWLDGEAVANQDQADALHVIFTSLDDAYKLAESTRKELKQPHMDAAAAVDGVYSPLRDKADKARNAVKLAIQRWNDHLAEIAEIEAARIRKEAEDAEALAQKQRDEALAANNLTAIEEAEQQFDNAVTLAAMAKKVEKAPTVTRAGGGRGIGKVPMHWVGRIGEGQADRKACLQHYMVAQRDELTVWLQSQVDKDVRAGVRVIPGCSIKEEKRA
ncbi:hypothetical protein [Sphingomonas sp. SRS2]|uniref:hypothetical protein n=1 Tax=Sphingomonas sp. SRS2 TaxID=133190 RepID=UPI00061844CF|nr:hypothetical protein [Sphingomonas sp. SRS2]KKC25809.1 hypothetical protein WP12_12195 [Sphingomonas sp. SRS2]